MLEIFFSPVFFNSVHQMVDNLITIATYLFTSGMVVYILAMVFRLSSGRENSDHFYHLLFICFSAIGLATYKIWVVWLGKLFVFLARAIFDLESSNLMAEYLGAFFSDGNGGLKMSMFNFLSLESLSSLSYMLVMIVYEIFVIVQVILQIFFYLLGPVSIVISLFPQFHDVFKIWLANFCAVNFWSVLVAILFRLVKTITSSPAFQQAVSNGDKGVLWDTFILGVLIAVCIVLIPKFAGGIFKLASASADMGTYGVGATAGIVISTVRKNLKSFSSTMTQRTGDSLISGARALTSSPAADAARKTVEAMTRSDPAVSWPFGGARLPLSGGGA
ncbi:MAG: hypothetical protein ACREOO_02695 [bacterium]